MLIKSTLSNETHHAECGWKSNGKAFRPKQFSACIIRVGKVGRKKKKGADARDGCAELIIFVVVMQYNHSLMSPFAEQITV